MAPSRILRSVRRQYAVAGAILDIIDGGLRQSFCQLGICMSRVLDRPDVAESAYF